MENNSLSQEQIDKIFDTRLLIDRVSPSSNRINHFYQKITSKSIEIKLVSDFPNNFYRPKIY
jgi:hypothetical protein